MIEGTTGNNKVVAEAVKAKHAAGPGIGCPLPDWVGRRRYISHSGSQGGGCCTWYFAQYDSSSEGCAKVVIIITAQPFVMMTPSDSYHLLPAATILQITLGPDRTKNTVYESSIAQVYTYIQTFLILKSPSYAAANTGIPLPPL